MNRTPPASSEEGATIKDVCGIDSGSQSCAGCICRPDKSVVEKRDHHSPRQGRLADLGRETDPVGCSSQPDPHRDGSHLPLCPRVAQRDAPFKENGSRSFIVACMGSAAPAELFPRQQEASDVTRITCEAAPHSTACLLSTRCATRGTLEYGEINSGGRGAETRLLPERKGRRTRCSQDPRGESWERSRNRPEPTGVLFSLI